MGYNPGMSTAARLHETDPEQVPPLENGDRLTREEFERRYFASPQISKAELIEGVVYLASPVNFGKHGRPHGIVMGWLATYVDDHPETDLGDNSTLRLDNDNEPQPDALLRYREGGTSTLDDEEYLVGVPELAIEVASSSTSIDTHAKKNAYRRNGIPEYMVWRVRDDAVDWFVLQQGEYVPIEPDTMGVIESRIFPGLRLNVPALIAMDLSAVLATQRGS